jgi:hypothetical protein
MWRLSVSLSSLATALVGLSITDNSAALGASAMAARAIEEAENGITGPQDGIPRSFD